MYRHTKRLNLLLVTLGLFLVGCSSTTPTLQDYEKRFREEPPSSEWLRNNIQNYREKAWSEPTKENVEIFALIVSELKTREAIEQKDYNWQAQTNRLYAQSWGNVGRGGAVLRQPAYIHVLANEKVDSTSIAFIQPIEPVTSPDMMIEASLNKLSNIKSGQSYSIYELARWERYCDQGRNMTNADWKYINDVGITNVPLQLLHNCTPPSK